MKGCTEDGMTILEVVIAITILLIGTGFVLQSNSLSYHYLGQQELRQQMIFYAAGAMEAALEGQVLIDGSIRSSSADVSTPHSPPRGLTPFKVTVSADSPGIPEVEMYNYRFDYYE